MEWQVLENFFHLIDDPRSDRNQKYLFPTLIGFSFLVILSRIDLNDLLKIQLDNMKD